MESCQPLHGPRGALPCTRDVSEERKKDGTLVRTLSERARAMNLT